MITVYNTPTNEDSLPDITKFIEDHSYDIKKVHHVEIRPGVKSGIWKYLATFKPERMPLALPETVELYGRIIWFEKTPNPSLHHGVVNKAISESDIDCIECTKSLKEVEVSTDIIDFGMEMTTVELFGNEADNIKSQLHHEESSL